MQLFLLLPFPIFYLIGAFPTGYLLARSQGLNILNEGSGNIGATNVARVLGKKMGILTLLIDSSKGLLATLLAAFISHNDLNYISFAALACVAGHCFSIPGRLTGGKGVATALGTLVGLNYWLAVTALVTFALMLLFTKVVSIGSLLATAAVVIVASFLSFPDFAWYALAAISLIIFYRHKDNLKRIAHGTEQKFTLKK